MKKIVLVTSNKRLIEVVTFALCEKVNIDIQLLSVTRYGYAVQDVKDFAPDLVIIDKDKKVRGFVESIKQEKIVDDFVLMRGSPDDLLNKLSEL